METVDLKIDVNNLEKKISNDKLEFKCDDDLENNENLTNFNISECLDVLDDLINQVNKNENVSLSKKLNEDEISISDTDTDLDSDLDSDLDTLSKKSFDDNKEHEKIFRLVIPPKTKGELSLNELNPIQELNIKCNVDQLQQLGFVSAILSPLVVVESFKNLPALDLDSILFLRDGCAVGQIFDVFGSVNKPYYCIRFKDMDQINKNKIIIGLPIYFLPRGMPEFTKYVLVHQLLKFKGSDASWFNNNEPPDHLLDYSDDEEEQKAKQKLLAKRKHDTISK